MSKYAEIIELLEKATGGDTELDARIWAALAGVKYMRHNKPYGDQIGRTQVEYTEPPKRTRQVTNPPRMPHAEPVTFSIDAALALVERMLPEANCYGVEKEPKCWTAYVSRNCVADGHWLKEASAATGPLAILLALFRALEAKESAE